VLLLGYIHGESNMVSRKRAKKKMRSTGEVRPSTAHLEIQSPPDAEA
jgi:hypothetical protein